MYNLTFIQIVSETTVERRSNYPEKQNCIIYIFQTLKSNKFDPLTNTGLFPSLYIICILTNQRKITSVCFRSTLQPI
jgi:hypothetical protein